MNFFKKARLFFLKSCLGVLVLGLTAVAQATPLRLDYSVTDLGGGLYDYNFILVLDNNDSSWAAGQNFNWIIWGDQFPPPTNLTNFVGDPTDLPVGPFTTYSVSGGGHNGPTFRESVVDFTVEGWFPTVIGDSLSWSGTSTANLHQGQLLWSILTGSGVLADFEVANRVPDPPPSP